MAPFSSSAVLRPSMSRPVLSRPSLPFSSPLLLLLLSILCLSLSLPRVSADWSLQGCYLDKPDIQERALPYLQDQEPQQTVAKCLAQCASHGYQWAGLQYKFECYCSKQPPKYEKVDDGQCSIPCAGKSDDGRPCGGSSVLSVYHNPEVQEPKTERPLVCLVMIIKNEAHTIMDTLLTVKDHIDCWYILDTGSEVSTDTVIRPLPPLLCSAAADSLSPAAASALTGRHSEEDH